MTAGVSQAQLGPPAGGEGGGEGRRGEAKAAGGRRGTGQKRGEGCKLVKVRENTGIN